MAISNTSTASSELLKACCVATVCILLNCPSNSMAEVVVYKETCGHDAFEDWNLTCKINKNTFISNEPSVSFANAFKGLQAITVCVSFSNRGGLNLPPLVVHNHSDGTQSKPTDLFDTVKFQGNLTTGKMSWIGTSPRRAPSSAANWSMQADLFRTGDQGPFVYVETLSNGQRPIGGITATCSFLQDE